MCHRMPCGVSRTRSRTGPVRTVPAVPLAAVQQPPQVGDRRGHGDAASVLDRMARRQLVGDRADPADPRRDVDRFGVRAAAQERLEEPWRLVDAQLGVLDPAVGHGHAQRTLALHAGQRPDAQAAVSPMRHRRLLRGTRRCGTPAAARPRPCRTRGAAVPGPARSASPSVRSSRNSRAGWPGTARRSRRG